MPWDQLQSWQAYYAIEPWGEERADLRNGMLCALTLNIHRDRRKGEDAKATDFMPFSEYSTMGGRVPGEKVVSSAGSGKGKKVMSLGTDGWARLKGQVLASVPKKVEKKAGSKPHRVAMVKQNRKRVTR